MAHSRTLRRVSAACLAALALSFSASAMAETVLRTVPSSDLKILDPIWTTAYITRNHGFMIYDTLFGMDEKGAIKPQMVDKYTSSADSKVWTFTLRSGLKFHDGAPVTSDDVIASLQRWGKRDALGQRMFEVMESITPEGANGFKMVFKQPFGVVLDALGKPNPVVPFIMPKRVASTPAEQQIAEFVGSGPFTMAKEDFRPGDRITYRKNPHYVPRSEPASGTAGGKVVKVDAVEWVILKDLQTQTNAIMNGEVDMLETAATSKVAELRGNKDLEIKSMYPGGHFTLHFNHKNPPFNNPKAVRAAMLAVNQEALLRAQLTASGTFNTCTSVYMCDSQYGSQDTGAFTGKPNFEEAKKLLKESGYKNEKVVLMLPGDSPGLSRMPVVYGQLLKQVGFNVEVQSTDWATLVTRRTKKEGVDQGGWSAFITYWSGLDAASPISHNGYTGNGDKGFFGWPVNPQVEALKQEFIEVSDAAKRKEIAQKLQTQMLETGVIVPLGEVKAQTAIRKNVVGLMASPVQQYWNVEKKDAK